MDGSGTPALLFPVFAPLATKERFAELTGLEVGVVRGMMDRGYLPTVKVGRHRLINIAAVHAACLEDQPDLGGGVAEDFPGYGRC